MLHSQHQEQSTALPVTIAPKPNGVPSQHHGANSDVNANTMPYTCQSCIRRKVKCDKLDPICSTCRKGGHECIYEAPPPRRKKRKRIEDVQERLARYERTLMENGLLSQSDSSPALTNGSPRNDRLSQQSENGELLSEKTGKLHLSGNKTRYISSRFWPNDLEEDELRAISEDEGESQENGPNPSASAPDPLSGALVGTSQDLLPYHPSVAGSVKLWETYARNVEPLVKVLHNPTAKLMVEEVAARPSDALKAQECVVFSIYFAAIISLTNDECMRDFGHPRATLLSKYRYAVHQALVNASWLRTTDIAVLQAMILYLLCVRAKIDPHTLWILTGVAVRIAQRMGLHREAANHGLSPFDVQMRRRLFWQVLPLDGFAGGMSGTAISLPPSGWDTLRPANINDDQIYPGMKHEPEEQTGATEMLFSLAKYELSNFYTNTGVRASEMGASLHHVDGVEAEKMIDDLESTIESKYLRYCDIVNPVHLLVLGMTRAAANTARLQCRLPDLKHKTMSDGDRKKLCLIARKILDTDNANQANPNLRKYQWHIAAFKLGPPLTCLLLSAMKEGFFTQAELVATWAILTEAFSHHHEILERRDALNMYVGKLALRAWESNPPDNQAPESSFITYLRDQQQNRKIERARNAQQAGNRMAGEDVSSLGSDFEIKGASSLSSPDDLNLDVADWIYWENLIQDYQNIPFEA